MTAGPRATDPSTRTRGGSAARRRRSATGRDDRLSRRAARALALGGQRPGSGGLRPVARPAAPSRISDRSSRRPSSSSAGRSSGSTGPPGAWTVRLASTIHDEPAGLVWDDAGLFVVKYGFHTYGLESRTGVLRWSHRSATPLLAVFGSPRLAHLIVQAEIETFALEPDGTVGWRIAHSDVVSEAAMVGGRLVLTSYGGQVSAIDPATGRADG